jgi:hypothetical protein
MPSHSALLFAAAAFALVAAAAALPVDFGKGAFRFQGLDVAQGAAASASVQAQAQAQTEEAAAQTPTQRGFTVRAVHNLVLRVRDSVAERQREENAKFEAATAECDKVVAGLRSRLAAPLEAVRAANLSIGLLEGNATALQQNLTELDERMELDRLRMIRLAAQINALAQEREQAHEEFEAKKEQTEALLVTLNQLQLVLTKQDVFNASLLSQNLSFAPGSGPAAAASLLEVATTVVRRRRADGDEGSSSKPNLLLLVGRDLAMSYQLTLLLMDNMGSYIRTLEQNERREQDDFNTIYRRLNQTAYERTVERTRAALLKRGLETQLATLRAEIARREAEIAPARLDVALIQRELQSQVAVCENTKAEFRNETEARRATVVTLAHIERLVKPLVDLLNSGRDHLLTSDVHDERALQGQNVRARPGTDADLDPNMAAQVEAELRRRREREELQEMRAKQDLQKALAERAQLAAPVADDDPNNIVFG